MKYAWITQHRDSFPVGVMCDVLNVSPSGYYDSIDRRRAIVRSVTSESSRPSSRSTPSRTAFTAAKRWPKCCNNARIWSRHVATPWRRRCVKWA